MKAGDLRASILQAAIQGKLVPQDPNDEPASALIERIREEKKKLIKEGKIKKDKNDSYVFKQDNHYYENINGKEKCIDNKIPFEIPETWSWVRMKNIGTLVRGSGIRRSEIQTKGLPCIRYGELYTTYTIKTDAVKSCISQQLFDKSYHINTGDLLMTLTGETKEDIAKTIAYCGTGSVAFGGDLVSLNHEQNPLYLTYLLNSPYARKVKSALSTGDQIIHIGVGKLETILFPIPPIVEQKRIASTIDNLMQIIDEYENYEIKLSRIDDKVKDNLKNSILQYAIQGKLVPQDSNDEPVTIDCKNPIIRRDNSYYEFIDGKEKCIDEEIAFDIPHTWQWTRLGYISNYGKNESVATKDIPDEAYVIELENIEKDTGRIIGYTPRQSLTESSAHHVFSKGDVLYSKLRPYLNKVVIPDHDGFCSGEIMALYFDDVIIPEYIQVYLMSPYFVEYAMGKAYGCKMPRLGTTDGKRALVAIPPISEQKRIVGKIRELDSFTNQLSY